MAKVLAAEDIPLAEDERERLVDVIAADLLGYGPLQPLLSDDSVSEIMVNGIRSIYIEKDGKLQRRHRSTSPTRTACARSSTASSPRSAGASTSPRPWWTPACPTAPACAR